MRTWGGIVSVLLFMAILVLMKLHTQVEVERFEGTVLTLECEHAAHTLPSPTTIPR